MSEPSTTIPENKENREAEEYQQFAMSVRRLYVAYLMAGFSAEQAFALVEISVRNHKKGA